MTARFAAAGHAVTFAVDGATGALRATNGSGGGLHVIRGVARVGEAMVLSNSAARGGGLHVDLLATGLPTVVFARTRQGMELLLTYLRRAQGHSRTIRHPAFLEPVS